MHIMQAPTPEERRAMTAAGSCVRRYDRAEFALSPAKRGLLALGISMNG